MALSHKSRRRWALIILLLGLPLYIILAIGCIGIAYAVFERPPIWVELAIYVVLGIAWALPFKRVFMGVGQADPNAPEDDA